MPLLPAITEARRSTWTTESSGIRPTRSAPRPPGLREKRSRRSRHCFPGASLDAVTESAARRLAWVLSGLTVQADWIGSNPEWFGPQDAGTPIASYWKQALARAETAIVAAGLHCARPSPEGAVRVLPATTGLRPMQAAVGEIDLPDGPVLALIEDATGAGKTEAALILAARMMEAGKGDGFFFALPTMATSNAMLARLEGIVPRLFDGRPALALTHGRAGMNERFRQIQGRDGSDPSGGPSCGSWLADDRRRILLADAGVGTIDQALMAVLPTRFNTLRLRALSGHILIVDEAHEFDPYAAGDTARGAGGARQRRQSPDHLARLSQRLRFRCGAVGRGRP